VRVLFIGTVEFSLQMLKFLISLDSELVGVVTGQDRGVNSDFADLAPVCEEYRIPVLVCENVNSPEALGWIRGRGPDVVFCFGWSRLLKKDFLQIPALGVIGYHPAELPMNRGRHPLIWALVLGLKRTASTFFFMDEGADSGDILSQQLVDISDEDDAGTLYTKTKVIDVAKKQLADIVPAMSKGHFMRIPQNNLLASSWRKRGMKDGEIDWRMSAGTIHNLVRGLTHPYVGAHFLFNEKPIKVWKTRLVDFVGVENAEPGKIAGFSSEGNLIVKCADGCIELSIVDPVVETQKGDYL